MIFKLKGMVKHVYEEECFDKKNTRWKRTIIITQGNSTQPNREEFIPIDFMDDDRGVIEDLQIGHGDIVEVDIELRGRMFVRESQPEKPLCYINVQGIDIKVI